MRFLVRDIVGQISAVARLWFSKNSFRSNDRGTAPPQRTRASPDMGLVGSVGKAVGAVAKFCDDYNVAVRPRSSRTAGISNASVARANPKKTTHS